MKKILLSSLMLFVLTTGAIAQASAGTAPTNNPLSIGATELRVADRGGVLTTMSQYIYAIPVPGAVKYRFVFLGGSSPLYLNSLSYRIKPAQISGIAYATTYFVAVEVYDGFSWSGIGNVWPITTPIGGIPTTQLTVASCGATLSTEPYVRCNQVSGATKYQFRFVHSVSSYTATLNSNSYRINAYAVPNIVDGLTYDVEVRAYVGGTWSNFGTSGCTVTLPLSGMVKDPNDNDNNYYLSEFDGEEYESSAALKQGGVIENASFIELFPNPSKDGNVNIIITSDEAVGANISLYDLSGREFIGNYYPITPGTTNTIRPEFGSLNLAKGIYIVKVTVGTEQLFDKLVIE